MKTKLDQTSIPPLCTGISEMAHTLVGKAVPLQVEGHGFKPVGGNLQDSRLGRGHHGKIVVFVFFVFFVL